MLMERDAGSSTGMLRHFHMGAKVRCLDGNAGTLHSLLLDESILRVTHLLLQRRAARSGLLLVPMAQVVVPMGERVVLGMTDDELDGMKAVIPQGRLLSRSSVVDSEGTAAGALDCVLMDPQTRRVAYLIARRGVLLHHELLIPAHWIREIQGNRVILGVGRQALARLRRFGTHRQAAYQAE